MTWSQTYSSVAFDLLNPNPELVRLEDIAHHLSLICRFKGACRCFYSVAQHSVLAAELVPRPLKRQTLMHDSHESYLGDWPRPLKVVMKQLGVLPVMEHLEGTVLLAIGTKFGLDLLNLPPEVKHADNVMLATEKRDLMGTPPMPWVTLPDPRPDIIEPWSPERAEQEFLDAWAKAA